MRPGGPGLDARIVRIAIGQEPREHGIVIAHQHPPGTARRLTLHQPVDDAAAVGAAIDQIAQEHDLGRCPAIGGDQVERVIELGQMAVNVADGVDRCVHGIGLAQDRRDGKGRPAPARCRTGGTAACIRQYRMPVA